ncbi:MAG: hypothetical protein QG583_26 [Patescibacteria group bacterium]|nr:hypothetical protein [Patescibacteria group bacterium]
MKKIKFIYIWLVPIFILIIYIGQNFIYKQIARRNLEVKEYEYNGHKGRIFQSPYAIAGSRVYFHQFGYPNSWVDKMHWIKGADGKTFEEIQHKDSPPHYAKDKNNVYTGTQIIPGADPATFEVLDKRYSRDKNSYFSSTYKVTEEEYLENSNQE